MELHEAASNNLSESRRSIRNPFEMPIHTYCSVSLLRRGAALQIPVRQHEAGLLPRKLQLTVYFAISRPSQAQQSVSVDQGDEAWRRAATVATGHYSAPG